MLSRITPIVIILASVVTLTGGAAPNSGLADHSTAAIPSRTIISTPSSVPSSTPSSTPGSTPATPATAESPNNAGFLRPVAQSVAPPSAPPAPRPSPSPFVTRVGTQLFLNGDPYRFTGISANELATYWPVNWGCGSEVDDIDGFFASLRPGSVVNFAAMQAMAFNNKPLSAPANKIDFTGIDRVVAAAERHGIKLGLGLADQQGTCDDGHWKGQAWYDGGFRQAFNDDGRNLSRLSYWDYIHLVVPRYRDSQAVAFWGPMGEPEASNCFPGYVGGNCYGHLTCPAGAARSLRGFFDTVGAEIKRMDPNHLIGTGTLSRGQCGLAGGGYRTVVESPYVDYASYHDYGSDATPITPDIAGALQDALGANKVFLSDEAGIGAGTCQTTTQRRDQFKAKMDAQFQAGSSGFVIWNWELAMNGGCDYTVTRDDPLMSLLLTYRVPLSR